MGPKTSKAHNKTENFALSKENTISTTTSSAFPSSETTTAAVPSEILILPDDVTIIWLDPKIDSISSDDRTTKIMLGKIHSSVFTFNDVQKCLDFLTNNKNRKARLFLVVSGRFSALILPNLRTLTIIDSIFIFCAHPEKYNYLITEYSPYVIGVFSELEALESRLKTELDKYHTRAPVLNFFAQKQSATRDLTHDAASFLWFQLLQKVLTETKYDANDMRQMLDYCRQHCTREPQQQKFFAEINEFERTYSSDDAIRWYTRQSFVYKLINRALRTEDIEALYIFRFYISDLCRQLANEHDKFRIRNQNVSILRVYRGCHMTSTELDKLHDTISDMTSINGFVSTSRQRWVADQFLSHKSCHRSDVEKVLWILEVNTHVDNIIFADIASFSEHPEEEEIIFNIGTAFRIDTITLDKSTNIWNLKATATNDGSHAVAKYMELIKLELDETSEQIIFGTLLIDMGNYLTAKRYFEDLIQRSDRNHPDLAAFHYNLGLTCSFQGDLTLAEQNLRRALDYLKLNPRKQRNVVRALNALGWVYQDNGELSDAIIFYKKAESICEEKFGSNDLANAQTYTYMGRYYLERGQYDKSKICYERALTNLRFHLPNHHQRFGNVYNEIADLKRRQGEPEDALKLYQQAEAVFRNILPEHHPCTAYCWSGMGLVLLQLNDIEEARRYHRKALKSYKRVLPPEHPNIKTSEKNLKCNNYVHIVETYLQICAQV